MLVTHVETATDGADLPLGNRRVTVVGDWVGEPTLALVEVVRGTHVVRGGGIVVIPREESRVLQAGHHHFVQEDLGGQSS